MPFRQRWWKEPLANDVILVYWISTNCSLNGIIVIMPCSSSSFFSRFQCWAYGERSTERGRRIVGCGHANRLRIKHQSFHDRAVPPQRPQSFDIPQRAEPPPKPGGYIWRCGRWRHGWCRLVRIRTFVAHFLLLEVVFALL